MNNPVVIEIIASKWSKASPLRACPERSEGAQARRVGVGGPSCFGDCLVRWYSGYKVEERPMAIIIDGEEQLVKKVLREELIEDEITGERKRIFIVETAKSIYKISNFIDKI